MLPQVPYNYAAAITKSDSVNITLPGSAVKVAAIFVGGAGNLVAVFEDDSTATFVGLAAGTVLPVSVKRVNSTNTTATSLLALFCQ